jgi:hypothetical protein
MTSTLQRAIAEAQQLPEADQEAIAREVLAHIAKLQALRADLSKAAKSLDAGEGKPLDVSTVMARARRGRGDQ